MTQHRFRVRGLRVVHQHEPGRLTAIALTVRAGARCDGRHAGLAHLAEHMLFQGTNSLDQVALNRRAAELGGEHNADTGYEDISLTFEVFNEDFAAEIAQLRRRKLTGPRLLKVADGVFASDMLNTMGNAFTRAYYYAKRGKYLEDYDDLLGADCPSLYHVRDTWANFDALRTRVDERFRSWLSKHAKGPSHERLSVLRKK